MSPPTIAARPRATTHSGVLLAQHLLTPVLRHWIAQLGGELSQICGYQLGVCEPDGTPTDRVGGKLLRPAFALLCSEAAGGEPTEVVPAATAIELLHNASLIHDDIMDGDRQRRHQPTVWARFGVSSAILAGDALIALGFEVLANSPHPATGPAIADLAKTLRLLARGQDSDLRFEGETAVGLDECLAMLADKTGVLYGCACRMGAVFAPARPDWAGRFEQFGTHIGVAFQLVDDLLGIWGDPRVTGKPTGSDLRARKKNAPVVAALAAGTAGSAQLSQWYRSSAGECDEDEVALMAELVEDAGGRAWTQAEARRRVSAAWDQLDGLDLDQAARTNLTGLTTAVLSRGG